MISISKLLYDNNVCIEFDKTCCVIKDKKKGIILMKSVAKDGLYKLLNLPHDHSQVKYALLSSATFLNLLSVYKVNKLESAVSISCVNHPRNENPRVNKILDLWHKRLGHPNVVALKKTLLACNISFGNNLSELAFYKACQLGKQNKLSFNNSDLRVCLARCIVLCYIALFSCRCIALCCIVLKIY